METSFRVYWFWRQVDCDSLETRLPFYILSSAIDVLDLFSGCRNTMHYSKLKQNSQTNITEGEKKIRRMCKFFIKNFQHCLHWLSKNIIHLCFFSLHPHSSPHRFPFLLFSWMQNIKPLFWGSGICAEAI